ncbi:WXG100 family type VII secretion target [Nocardia panacis]|uniref:ESAT-6-like protein n=1 Tax=Nocardia panacis TaxID=2340916 RepID=A0A3A4K7C6_9NOCA|nr:WXG100 family type VII secretion target [Nocardia panacis]RJO70617.1 WXG100 family type VII secretion target [Nocardia panacis]
MADRVDVSPAELQSAADGLDRLAQDLADAVDRHMRAVRTFLGSDWQGTAADSHESPWTDWEDGARRVISSFVSDAANLRTAAGGYRTSDDTSAQAIVQKGFSLNLPDVR